jgi:hypothetical protein
MSGQPSAFDARRAVARTIGMTPGARSSAVAISCVDNFPGAKTWRPMCGVPGSAEAIREQRAQDFACRSR